MLHYKKPSEFITIIFELELFLLLGRSRFCGSN